jgi:hypothetical protein
MAEQNNRNQQPANQLQVKITDEILRGVYANMVQVGHTAEEFILDFLNIVPPSGIVVSRVIVSPSHFKRLVSAMQENLKRYEAEFGTISLAVVPDQSFRLKPSE